MPRYKLTIEYDGNPFVGWQRQADGVSVQGTLETALAQLDDTAPAVQGAGRTDSGVHATGQVAHCDMSRAWDPFRLGEALNYHVKPLPVAILSVEAVHDDFHARFDAIRRSYLYRLRCRRAPLTFDRGRIWRIPERLNVDAMQAAANQLIGRHDFTTFRSVHCQSESPVKTLDLFEISGAEEWVECRLEARSFLHNQVRSFVGTLVQVGLGRWPVGRVADALAAADRAACGPVAPPDGLYLTSVQYPPESGKP